MISLLDYGCVIFNESITKVIQVFNHGYLDANIVPSIPTTDENLIRHGIKINWSGLCYIRSGDFGEFTVTLNPNKSKFPKSFYDLNVSFSLQVVFIHFYNL